MKRSHVVTLFTVMLVPGFGVASVYAQPEQGKGKQEGQKKAEKQPEKKTEEKAPALPSCPVSGKPINFAVSVMTDDGPVYFCCPACPEKYQADPKKYAEKVAEQRKALAAMPRVQVTCPVSGKAVDQKVFIEKGGKKIYFCCKECPPQYEKDPAKYAAKLGGCYSYQTKCPVSGEEISPKSFVTLEGGMKVYFCCGNCIPKFEADPAKYTAKLKEQGISIDPAKMKITGREMGKGMGEKEQQEKPKEPAK
ncbi:MAG TPA: hypothetical protein VMV94_15905 [Phycisphaerae bacterium]|nr:hypothetical protein [Phycisphaerae bacterium]